MALRPNRDISDAERKAVRRAAEDEALMRQVDDAVRQDRYADFGLRYGKPLIAVVVIALAAFGGFLFWQHRQGVADEKDAEIMVTALDRVQAGDLAAGREALRPLIDDGSDRAKALALLMDGAVAAQADKPKDAVAAFQAVAEDEDAPRPLRDLATIRAVTQQFDTLEPGTIEARLKPLATPDNPFFGSAGELLAMAYLQQDKRAEAGELFARIAKTDSVPATLRSRARQMAGALGVDAVVDVEQAIAQSGVAGAAGPPPGAQ